MRKSYRDDNGEKIYRYSIRKYHFGAASVAVAALMFFANGVQAQTPAISSATASDVVAGSSGNSGGDSGNPDDENSKQALPDQPDELKPADELKAQGAKAEEANQGQELDKSKPTPVGQESPQGGEVKEQDQPITTDRKAAELAQGTLEALLAKLTLSSMQKLHAEVEARLAAAKAVLDDPNATQEQVDEQVRLMEDLIRRVNKVLDSRSIKVNATPKEKLEKLSQSLNTYFKIASEITRPETKELIKGTEDIIHSVNEGLQQPDLTDEKIQSLIEQGKQAERKLALAVTREKSGKRDLLTGKTMKTGSDFRATPTALNTKRAYIVQNGDGSGLLAETYLYALHRGINDKPSENNLVPVSTVLDEAKITVTNLGNGDFRWDLTFNGANKGHQNAFYWFTLPKGHTITDTLAVTRTHGGGTNSFVSGDRPFNEDWGNGIKRTLGAEKAVYGPAKGWFDFNSNFNSLTDVTNTNFIAKSGQSQRVGNDPTDKSNSDGYYYLGPTIDRFRRWPEGTAVSKEVVGKAKRNIEGLHENSDVLYHFTLNNGLVRISYKTHTNEKYAPLYYGAGMRSVEYSTANMYFMARGLQEAPTKPNISINGVGNIAVSPSTEKADKLEITYTDKTSGEEKTATLIRNNQNKEWSKSGTGADGIDISRETFTLRSGVAKIGTTVKAKAWYGNSDASPEATVTVKKQTDKPTVTPLDDGSVTVQPNGNADSLSVKYIDESKHEQSISATKSGNRWSLNGGSEGIEINANSGLLTINATKVDDGSLVKAQAQANGSDELISEEATATAKNEDRTPPTISVKDGTTWRQGNSNGAVTLLANHVNGEIKLNIKIEDNTGGRGFGEFSARGNDKTADYSISGGSYDSTSTTFSGGRYSGKDQDATALLTLKLNRKANGEYEYPSTGFTVTIKARDNSPRKNWTTATSTPKELTITVKPKDSLPPKVKIVGDNGQDVLLTEGTPDANLPKVTVYRGEKANVTVKASDNTGKIQGFTGSNVPSGVWFNKASNADREEPLSSDNATEANPLSHTITGVVEKTNALEEKIVTVRVSDKTTPANSTTVKFKMVVKKQAEKYTPNNVTTPVVFNNLGTSVTSTEDVKKITDQVNVTDLSAEAKAAGGVTKALKDNGAIKEVGGKKVVTVIVTYPDNSIDEVNVPVTQNYNVVARPTINFKQGETLTDADKRSLVQLQDGDRKVDIPSDATVTFTNLDTSMPANHDKTVSKIATATITFADRTVRTINVNYKVLSTFPIAETIYDFKDVVRNDSDSDFYRNTGKNIPDNMTWIYKASDGVEKSATGFRAALAADNVGTTTYTYGGKYGYSRFTDNPSNATEKLEHTATLTHKVFDIQANPTKVTVKKGDPLNSNNAKAAVTTVTDSDGLPNGTTYEWVENTDTSIPGVRTYKVRVTLPPSQSGNDQPNVTQKRPTKTIEVKVNVKPTAPTVTAETNGDVTVTPANETNVNKVEVTYTPSPTISHLTETEKDTFEEHNTATVKAEKIVRTSGVLQKVKKMALVLIQPQVLLP